MNAEPLLKKQRTKKLSKEFHLCMDVTADIASACGINREEITRKNRHATVVGARHLAMYILNNLGVGRRYICQFFNRDRTSIYHSLDNAQNLLDTDVDVQEHTKLMLKEYEQRRI